MKNILLLIFVILTTTLFAQKDYPRVEKIIINDKVFRGQIDKYPVTIYLKFYQFSNYHGGVYSVEGWYYYDKVKTRIPLSGLYNHPKLTLYNFQEDARNNQVLNFSDVKINHWEDMEFYENLKGFNEKFILSDQENIWMNDNKTLEVKLNNEDLSIREVEEYLFLDPNTAFDLHNFGAWTWNFDIKAHKNGKYILHFVHSSRLYAMGACGAGEEKGYLTLEFDQKNRLVNSEEFTYESCNRSISLKNQEQVSDQLFIKHCHNFTEDTYYDLIIDYAKMEIKKEAKN